MSERVPTNVRLAKIDDLTAVVSLVDEFAKGHPSEGQPRFADSFEDVYFGPRRAAELVVAEKGGVLVGMCQWMRVFDMFWATWAGRVDWLYVRPEARGTGIFAAMLALICQRVRSDGGKFVVGQGTELTTPLYQRCAIKGSTTSDFHLSEQAFEQLADLAGCQPREVVKALPEPGLNYVARRERAITDRPQ